MSSRLLQQLDGHVRELRGSLTALLAGVGLDPAKPQEVARRLGLDKSLTWKISKIIRTTDIEAMRHVPGTAALDLLLNASGRAGAAPDVVRRAREAATSLDQAVMRHVGDRPTLELVLDGLAGRDSTKLLTSRKLAFRGNSGIWGVQAKLRLNTVILAPSAVAPDRIDACLIGGWIDFRRLREEARWVLFRRFAYEVADSGAPAVDEEPVGEHSDLGDAKGPMLLKSYCTRNMPPINAVPAQQGVEYELGPGVAGNAGAFDCVFASITRSLGSRFASEPGEHAEFRATISAPAESLLFDLLIHRDAELSEDVRTTVFGSLHLMPDPRQERDRLPIPVQRQDIGRYPPVLDAPDYARYAQLVKEVTTACGWSVNDFRAQRFTLQYPPYPATVEVAVPLESRPSE